MAAMKIDESVFDKLVDILKKHDLSEIEYGDGDVKIRLVAHSPVRYADIVAAAPRDVQQVAEPESEKKTHEPVNFASHAGAVTSPMVGTCYLAPEPGASNYISVGDTVQEGQPLVIIEAMKVMNLIKAPKSGKVIHIAVNNLDPIEFGQLLCVIE
jgi:acetyl-CoA carboxylase biotin carboxyl carrier protein